METIKQDLGNVLVVGRFMMNSQIRQKGFASPAPGARKGRWSTISRQAWAVVALLGAGSFLHDAWHLMLAFFGMNTLMGMEFSLPDLGAHHIYLDRTIQTFAFLFSLVVSSGSGCGCAGAIERIQRAVS